MFYYGPRCFIVTWGDGVALVPPPTKKACSFRPYDEISQTFENLELELENTKLTLFKREAELEKANLIITNLRLYMVSLQEELRACREELKISHLAVEGCQNHRGHEVLSPCCCQEAQWLS